MTTPRDSYDIVIVGGRVAGSATAIALARHGYRILLIERSKMPSDTLSTHFLWPDGVAALKRLGVLDEVLATGAPEIPAFQSWHGEDRLVADLVPIDGIDYGICPRRHLLDGILFERAAGLPEVDALDGTPATCLLRDGERVTGIEVSAGSTAQKISCDLVIGADGRRSFIAREIGAEEHDVVPPGRFWYYAYFENATPPEPPAFIVSSTETDFIGSAPTNDGLQMVLYGSNEEGFDEFRRDHTTNYLNALQEHPAGEQMLGKAELASDVVGIAGIRGYYRDAFGPGWALVGDAVHQKDPIAGRGVNEALRGGEWLADALAEGISQDALRRYAETMRAKTWSKYQFTKIIVRADRYRTDEQSAIMDERLVSDDALTEFMRLWYDDRVTFEEYFGASVSG